MLWDDLVPETLCGRKRAFLWYGATVLDLKQPHKSRRRRASGLLESMQGRKRAVAQSGSKVKSCSSLQLC